jgi:hypothetical protein
MYLSLGGTASLGLIKFNGVREDREDIATFFC